MKQKLKHIIAICFLLSPISVWSQDVISVRDLLADTAYMEKLPIPMGAITSNIEETFIVIEEVKESLGFTPDQLTRIDSILNNMEEEQSKFQNQITEEYLESSSTISLDESISEIEQVDSRIAGYSEIIQEEILDKEQDNKKIDDLLVIWDVSYKSERTTKLSDAIKINIQNLIDTLKKTDGKIDTYLNNLLELQLKLNAYHSEFDNLVKQVKDARGKASRNLWIPDSDPIWMIYIQEKDTLNLPTRMQKIWQNQKADIVDYYQNYRGDIYVSVFLIILIQILFFIIRYSILKDQIEDPEYDNAVIKLFVNPFYPALLIGLYVSILMLPYKPVIVDQLIYMIGLIPFTVILANRIMIKYRYLAVYLSFILALTIITELGGYKIEIFGRTFMLLITILAIILAILVLKTDWNELELKPSITKLIRILIRGALFVLLLCLVGNIAGNYTLTTILLNGILNTAFLGILMYLIYIITIGLFETIMDSAWGQNYGIVKRNRNLILSKIDRITTLILSLSFIIGSLKGFNIYSPIYDAVEAFLVTSYTLGSFSFSVNDILLFFIVLLISSWLAQFIEFILQEQVFFKSRKKKNLAASISSLVTFTIITIGFFIAALASGFPLDKLALLISAFGVGIGFGLQNIFNNLVSGIILVFERPLEVGDTIEVGQLLGVVKKIGIRASTVRTFDGSEVIVPNGNLISNELINWTHSDYQRRLIIKVGVAYGTDPKEVIKILLGVAKKNKGLLEDPEPYVLFKEFGDSALGFELRCFTESEDWLFILSDLHVEVNNALKNAGVVIPFPQRDLHVKSMDPNIVKSVKSTSRTR
jgi:small-conductance mechanosensitive channel